MSEHGPTGDEVRAAWDALATYWDEQMEAGATWQGRLIQPAVDRLLQLRSGERVLEIACGNGEFSRWMASLGASVLATDFSEAMLERARSYGGGVDYRLADATDEHALLAVGDPGSFDVAVSNMAIMDMTELEPMVAALSQLLRPDGRFVFSTLHPSFNSGTVSRVIEQTEDADGSIVRTYSVRVSGYATPFAGKGVALEGQPVTQWYFHRSLAAILEPCFRHGFVLDGLEEPVLSTDGIDRRSTEMIFTEIPGVLVARMRLLPRS